MTGILYNRIQKFQKGKAIKPSFEEYYKTVPKFKNDTISYDLRAAYENLPYEEMKQFAESEAHLPDTYKKPNHPTFSNESIYHNKKTQGGKWLYNPKTGADVYKPSITNIKALGGFENYIRWFRENEPGIELDLSDFK